MEFGCEAIEIYPNGQYLGQPRAWNCGKVVVFVVVADVERNPIERTVIAVRFVALFEHVMFGYEVSRDGMKAHRQH